MNPALYTRHSTGNQQRNPSRTRLASTKKHAIPIQKGRAPCSLYFSRRSKGLASLPDALIRTCWLHRIYTVKYT